MANLVYRDSALVAVLEVTANAPHNKSLQGTFDPPSIFASAKTAAASNGPELNRWALLSMSPFHPSGDEPK
jgi:hypothetical protein